MAERHTAERHTAERHVAVVGGGISGLAAAYQLATASDHTVTLFEQETRLGGKINGTSFAGVTDVDEGADAFLARVPDAVALACAVGLESELVSPEPVGAAVWYDGLHPIPDGLLLGMPSQLRSLATSKLLSRRGIARAALEPLLPRTSLDDDSIGSFVRARFGDEVHERLVDALVGSIYAADTDRFSLQMVPQLQELAASSRSMLLGARAKVGQSTGTATAASSPIFAAPRGGVSALARATAAAIEAAGGRRHLGTAITTVEPDGRRWRINDARFDAVILATPAAVAGRLLNPSCPEAAALLGRAETADVAMITLHVPAAEWQDRWSGMSGYLVPKPVQRDLTAVSFGSQKWAHWEPPAGGVILRASIGRDGAPIPAGNDDDLVSRTLDDLARHLGVMFTPRETRVTRWPAAFAQYRPHHPDWVAEIDRRLPPGMLLAGSSYRGIGIPACIRDGRQVAARAANSLDILQD
jgi:oxygen-dependent protoporphyrinogen oxidase